jgi:hypothetical protein
MGADNVHGVRPKPETWEAGRPGCCRFRTDPVRIAALERAAAAGLKEAPAVEREKTFDRWRSDAAFNVVLEKLR